MMVSDRCLNCNNLEPQVSKPPGHVLLFYVKDLRVDCRYCSLLRAAIFRFAPDVDTRYVGSQVGFVLEQGCPVSISVTGFESMLSDSESHGDHSYVSIVSFKLFLQQNQICEDLPSLGHSGKRSERSDSDECFDFIASMIRECSHLHSGCRRPSSSILPRRLLSVGRNEADLVRLLESRGICSTYATLSYRWGGIQPLKTTMVNLAGMYHGIHWDEISPVFQNAIQVCRRLNVEYLWIDALCIIQDNSGDWDTESSRMCEYYENALFTIFAASSTNSNIPFLDLRDHKWWTQTLSLRDPNSKPIDVFARRSENSLSMSSDPDQTDLDPTIMRAWIMQELMLSTRVLHFNTAEVVWECKSYLCSEDGMHPPISSSFELWRKLLRCQQSPDNGWHDLIAIFSGRHLTYETDRLPALAGIASKLSVTMQSDYWSGLWARNLPYNLCWWARATSLLPFRTLDSEYLAPSWAWPSVQGITTFPEFPASLTVTPFAEIKEIKCTTSPSSQYGKVTDGRLVLRGPVSHILLICEDPLVKTAYALHGNSGTRKPIVPDSVLVEANGSVRRARGSEVLAPFSLPVSCMLIYREIRNEQGWTNYHILIFGKLDSGKFQRVGCATFYNDEHETLYRDSREDIICVV